MSTCETCRWWNSPKLFFDGPEGQGSLWVFELGQCMSERFRKIHSTRRVDEPPNSNPDDACIDIDFAHLMTGPQFGCVHHEAK